VPLFKLSFYNFVYDDCAIYHIYIMFWQKLKLSESVNEHTHSQAQVEHPHTQRQNKTSQNAPPPPIRSKPEQQLVL